MNLLILAAGLGQRLKPYTDIVPKPALPILNIPMLLWNYELVSQLKFSKIVVNTYHLENKLREVFKTQNFIFSSDGNEILGTGGGITHNQDLLNESEDFWVINGDTLFLTQDLFCKAAQAHHEQTGALCTLVVCEHEEVGKKFGGVWVDSFGKILHIGKTKPARAVKGYHFTGFRILSHKIFDQFTKDSVHEFFDTINRCLEKNLNIQLFKVNGEFFETGNPTDYLKTQKTLLEYLKVKKYKFIETLLNKYCAGYEINSTEFKIKLNQSNFNYDILSSKKLRVFENTHLDGFIITGEQVTIRENCNLKNVVILNNQDIPPHTEASDCLIYEYPEKENDS